VARVTARRFVLRISAHRLERGGTIMMKRVLTATALAAVLAVPAFAQQPMSKPDTKLDTMQQNSANMPANAGFVQQQSESEWRGSKLIGTSVYGPDNKSIGTIDDVIVASNGQIKAAVVGVGGFLGVGQKDVAVPFASLNITRKPDSNAIEKIAVSYTKDQLQTAPKFAYYQAPNSRSTTGSGLNSLNKGSMGAPKPMGVPK
jgi:sporulation protein YlmC with PRC-barrel domain